MHELAVTESILNLVVEHARKAGARRVTDIYLVIGRLSSIVDESVQFYWEIISAENGDGLCKGAILHFERIPARMLCLDCGNEYILDSELTFCPQCNSAHVRVNGGDEFRLDSIAIET